MSCKYKLNARENWVFKRLRDKVEVPQVRRLSLAEEM
jgi:hypothetical protein